MTSTNDGKDVKSNQTSSPKGKTYYIELYKSLESRLSGECSLRARTGHLGEAWRRVHSLCQHSAPSTHPHLLSWLQRHTAKTVLQTEWQSPTSKDEHKTLDEAINAFINESQTAITARNGVSPAWESQLLQRAEWFRKILSNPWGHPVLRVLLDPRGKPPSDDEILEWLKEERGVMFVTRLRQLAASKCDDLAMLLAAAIMGRVRAETTLRPDAEQCEEPRDKPQPESSKSTFTDILKTEAGFTVDVWELLTDIEFVLLYKRDRHSSCIDLAKQTPLRNGYQLVERLQSRLETSPREKKLWKNAKEVAALITQVIIARCMVVPVCGGVSRSALYCCTRSLVRLVGRGALPAAAAALAAPACTARHLHTLAAAVDAQSTEDMKPFVCELYVRAITAGMNELERLKINAEKESEARLAEQVLSAWFTQLGGLLSASDRIKCECTLTAFSVHPSPAMYERIKSAPLLPPVAIDTQEPKDETTNSEYGSWASDSRSQTNFVKTSETLNLKQTQFQANVLSTALLTEGERLGLGAEVCQDIAVLLSGPRVKTLSWDMDRELLLENCRTYMERTHGGTRALTTELKYLNLDPRNFQHLPEEDEDDTDIYYGIEKGYEHLVEFQEPEEIWQDAIIDPEQTETAWSSSLENDECITVRRKKKTKRRVGSSEEESDPLSLVAEAKRAEGKKERPHSKERSKEHRQNKSREKIDKPKKEHSHERRKETHKKDKKEKKERKKRKKHDKIDESKPMVDNLKMAKVGALSSLIGMKIANMKKNMPNDAIKATLSITGYESQEKLSLNSLNSEGNDSNVLFDGLYSMDELKSPEKSSHATNQIYNDKSSVSASAVDKPTDSMIMQNDSKNRVPTIPDCLSYVPNITTVSKEVKLSITKLIHFRRQRQVESALKAEYSSPVMSRSPVQTQEHSGNWDLMAKQTYKSPKVVVKPEITFQSQISPKVVTIPDIPKMYIDKKQVEQPNNEVNKLLNSSKVPKNIRYPVTPGNNNISITNNTEHLTAMSLPEKNKDIKMHSNINVQKQHSPLNVLTEVGKRDDQSTPGVVPNATDIFAKFDTPSQIRFQEFLKELQESINAGAGKEKPKIFLGPQNSSSLKELLPKSKETSVISNTKAETKFSPQSAKQLVQQKKVENSLNTFSRLSYMHKNKLTDSKIKQDANTDHRDPLQQRIGSAEIERALADHKNAKMKHLQSQSDLVISRICAPKINDKSQISIKKVRSQEFPVCKEHPVLSDLLQNQIKNVQMERPNFSPPSVPIRTSSLLEKDHEDLKLLLKQQGKLNAIQMAPRTDNTNRSVHNVQLPQSPTCGTLTNNTTSYTKIPPSNTKIATPQITVKQAPNRAAKIPTVTNNIMSTTVDIKPSQQQPINMTKPVIYNNEALNPKDYSFQLRQDKVIVKACEENSTSNEDKKAEWESVMNAILAHKTPSRGPNALEMALKDSYKGSDTNLRDQRIVRTKSTGELNLKDKVSGDIKYHNKDLLKSKTKLTLDTSRHLNVSKDIKHHDKTLPKSKTKPSPDSFKSNLNVSNDIKHHDKGLPKSKTKSSPGTLRSNPNVSNVIKHHEKGLMKSKTKSQDTPGSKLNVSKDINHHDKSLKSIPKLTLDTSCSYLNVPNDRKHPDMSLKPTPKLSIDTSCSYLNVSNGIKLHDKSIVKSKIKLAHDTSNSNLSVTSISNRKPGNVTTLHVTCKSKPRETPRVIKQLNTHALACTSTSNIIKTEILEASKKNSRKSSQMDDTAKLSCGISNNQYTPDNRKRQFTCSLPKEDDPFISGIQNSDYDLLEELMDDDLRQEIGELSSDEETYRTSLESQKDVKNCVSGKSDSNNVNKSYHTALIDNKIRAHETMHVPITQQKSLTENHNTKITTEAALQTKAYSANIIKPGTKDILNPDTLLNKPCIRPPNVIRNSPSNIVLTPKNDTKQYINATNNNVTNVCNSQVKDPSNVFMTVLPQPTNLQNVVIIGSELIYDPYTSIQGPIQASVNSIAQNTYVAYSNAPNMTLFHTTQFAAPAVNPLIIGNVFTTPVAANVPSTIASPIINNVQSLQHHTDAHNIIVQNTLQSEVKNKVVKKAPMVEQYFEDSYPKVENKVQLDVNSNKNSERKVLSQVQEKQSLTAEKIDNKNHRLSIENDMKKQTLNDLEIHDQERLKKKRMAIMNREICHRCDNKPIPLAYEPLTPQAPCALDESLTRQLNTNQPTVTSEINECDLKFDTTPKQKDLPNKEIITSANLDGNENCKENKSTSIPCRRIMLRSSNKLITKLNSPPEVSKNLIRRKSKVRLKDESPQKFDESVESSCEGITIEDASVPTPKRSSKTSKKIPREKDAVKKVAKTRCKRNKVTVKNKRQSKLQNGRNITNIESEDVKFIDIEDELLGSKILKHTSQTILNDKMIEAKPCQTMSIENDKQEFIEPKITSQTNLTIDGTEAMVPEIMSDIDHYQPKVLNDDNMLHTNKEVTETLAKLDDSMLDANSDKTVLSIRVKTNNTKPSIAEDNRDIIEPSQGEKQYKKVTKTDENKPEKEIALDVMSSKKTESGQSLQVVGSDYNENFSNYNSSNNSNIRHNDIVDINTVGINEGVKDTSTTCGNMIDTVDLSVKKKINNGNKNIKKKKIIEPRQVPSLIAESESLPKPTATDVEKSTAKMTNEVGAYNRESMDNIPQSFKDSIIIEPLPNDAIDDSIKKCVRIKLPSGRSFKATVHGTMPVNFDSLFADPAIKSILLNTLNYKNKYTLNIKQVTTSEKLNPHKILETRFQDLNVRPKISSEEIETVNLLSDDEDEGMYQSFKTEFGNYKILSMDRDIFTEHQNKLYKKCCVKLVREKLTQSNSSKENVVVPSTDDTEDSKLDSITKINYKPALPVNVATENNIELFAGKIDDILDDTKNTITGKTCNNITNDAVNNENDDIIVIDDSSNDSINLASYTNQPLDDFPTNEVPERDETINELKDLLLKELGVDEALKESSIKNSSNVATDNNKTSEVEQSPSYQEDVSKCVVKITKCDDLVKKYDTLKVMKKKCLIALVRCDDLVQNTSLLSMKHPESEKVAVQYTAGATTLDTIEQHDQDNFEIDVQNMTSNTIALSRSGSYSILDDFSLFDDVVANIESEHECDRSSPVMEVFEIIAALDDANARDIRKHNKQIFPSTELSCDTEWLISKRSLSGNHKKIINSEKNIQNKMTIDENNPLSKEVSDIIENIIIKQNGGQSTTPESNMSCDSEWFMSKRSESQNRNTILNTSTFTENKISIDEDYLLSKEVSNITESSIIKQKFCQSTCPEFNISCESEWLISKRSISQNLKMIINAATYTQNKMTIVEDNLLSKEVSDIIGGNIIERNLRLSASLEFTITCESEWLISKPKFSQYFKTVTNDTTLNHNKIIPEDNLYSEEVSSITVIKILDQNIRSSSSSALNISCDSEWFKSKPKISKYHKTVMNKSTPNIISIDVENLLSKDTITTCSNYNSKDVLIEELRPLKICVPTLLTTVSNFLNENPIFIHKLKPSHKRKITNECSTVAHKISKINVNTSNNEKMHKISRVKSSRIKYLESTADDNKNKKLEETKVYQKHDDRHLKINLGPMVKIVNVSEENSNDDIKIDKCILMEEATDIRQESDVADADMQNQKENNKNEDQASNDKDKNGIHGRNNTGESDLIALPIEILSEIDDSGSRRTNLDINIRNQGHDKESASDFLGDGSENKFSQSCDGDDATQNIDPYEINIEIIVSCADDLEELEKAIQSAVDVDKNTDMNIHNSHETKFTTLSDQKHIMNDTFSNQSINNTPKEYTGIDARSENSITEKSESNMECKDTENNSLRDNSNSTKFLEKAEEDSFVAPVVFNKPDSCDFHLKFVDENPIANEKLGENIKFRLKNVPDRTSAVENPPKFISEDTDRISIHDDSKDNRYLEEFEKSRISKGNTECSVDKITDILSRSPDTEFTLITKYVSGIYAKNIFPKDGNNKILCDNPKNTKPIEEISLNTPFTGTQLEDDNITLENNTVKCTEGNIVLPTPDIKLLFTDKDDADVALKQILGENDDRKCPSKRTQNRKCLEGGSSSIQSNTNLYLDLKFGEGNLEDNEIINENKILTMDNTAYMNILENTSKDKQVTLIYKKDSGMVLKGIEYEDPEMGTCYMFPLIEGKFDNGENYDINAEEATENISEIDIDNTIEDEAYFKVIIPKVTYSKKNMESSVHIKDSKIVGRNSQKNLKRKINMIDVKIAEKRYRKGKNIDHPKSTITAINNTTYCKEYRSLFEYCNSVKFSYSRPFHKEYIEVQDILTAWPIKGPCAQTKDDIEIDENLFIDIVHTEKLKDVQDPMQKTLAEELIVEYKEPLLSSDINETNFSMGFGERSDRVIQNLEDGGDISTFSAATLSDVKQTQPCLLSEKYKVCINEQCIANTNKYEMKAIDRYFNNIYLKDKVRSFFKKTTIELNKDWIKELGKKYKDEYETTKFPYGLNLPDFIEPPPMETILQVVQVGQLPVSAAAQNPVTCDPRVTQVSDASPSQCSAENSPHDDSQSPVQNEYTELTTADLRLPMQEYAQHNQMISMESQESMNLPLNDENIPIETEIKSVVKIELMEEVPEDKEDQNESLEYNEQQTMPTNHVVGNIDYSYDTNSTNMSSESDSNIQLIYRTSEKQGLPESFSQLEQQNDSSDKTDQIAHAMNAAGIITSAESLSNARAQALVNMLSQKIRQGAVGSNQTTTNNYSKATSINAMALQQALAQILPPPLNQSSTENNQQTTSNPVTPQVLHIVQGKTASGNQITLVDNTQQSVISTPNSTPVLHIVQNKSTSSVPTTNGTPAQQSNSFGGLSLVDTGLQQGGNQLLQIVNTGSQKNNTTGQLLKRVNLLTNLTNVQGSNEQKMVQFVCKSADGKAIQLNAPHQRSMVLRLQPIESQNITTTPKSIIDPQDLSPSSNPAPTKDTLSSQQEIKSRSVYEENYAKFIQNSSAKTPVPEKSTSLPKFNQAFGKQVYQDGNQKQNEMINGNSHLPPVNTNPEHTECQSTDNNINLEHISQISSPPLILRKSSAQSSQPQSNLVQQIKQTIAPMNIQTMHGGVIYTRQIPVNIGGGQTINLITVPSTELIDDSTQKQQSDVKYVNQNEIEPSIIKIVPQSQPAPNAEVSAEDNNSQVTNDNAHTQPQPVLTQMRIKLPMLSKNPQMVSGARVVRPSFFQIQRNVIGGANQPVYQQLVLTTAPPLGQQTIRLPQTQTSRQIKVPSESQSSTESQMSSSTLEQLREFDLVLEQVKERSTVQPNGNSNSPFSKLHSSSTDTTDGATSVISTPTEPTQQVLYSIGNNHPLNVTYVNRKATVTTPTTSTYVRSPDSSGMADSPSSSTHVQIPHTVTTESSSSDIPSHSKAAKVGSKSKSRPKASSNPPNTMKINTVPPRPSLQKPLEDEQTTQRILYILAEYKEQVENSPDKDKPAPRRRANIPSNPGSSKRKKSSSGSRRPGARDMSPIYGEDTCRTMGSEDSSCGTSQGDCNESCLDSHSPQDSPRKFVRRLTFEQDTPIVQPRPLPQRNVIVADGQTITVARGTAGKPTTAVLMPANYILPVSMVKGGQQIAIVTNRGPKLLTVGGEGGTTNALLLQRLIGPAGLKPVLTRPGVRHVRLPTAALHNLQAFNLATATTVQPPDSTASHASTPAPPELIDTRASGSPWANRDDMKPDRGSSPEESEPWNLASSADPHDYTYEETVRTDNMNRTVLVVHKKDGHRQHRLTHVSAAALRHKYAILEHELRLQKSLSEECEDLGVDSPSAAELFPEAELLFATSPAHDHVPDQGHHSHTPQPIIMSGSSIPQPDLDDQTATDQILTRDHIPDDRQDLSLGLEDVGIVTVSEDGMQATIALDQEEFARSHPNTTFHSEPDVGVVQPFTIAGLKTRHITSIFHANRPPATVLMTAPQTTVISQATAETHAVKYSDIDNMINSIPAHSNNINLSSVLVKDDRLTRFDNILTDSRELHLSNTASAIIHSSGNATQVIRRVCYDDDKRERDSRFLLDEPEGLIAGNDAKMVAEDSSRDATLRSMTGDVDDDRSSPERHAELFWESNSASERSEGRRPLDFSSDSDKCCKSPSFDETNSTDSSGVGTHMRLDSVIKEARGIDRSASAGSSADDTHPPLRTYPPKRLYQPLEMERSVSGKTRAGERSPDVRRRASGRGVVKRGCHCCNGSPAPTRPKKSRQKKPTMDFSANN